MYRYVYFFEKKKKPGDSQDTWRSKIRQSTSSSRLIGRFVRQYARENVTRDF